MKLPSATKIFSKNYNLKSVINYLSRPKTLDKNCYKQTRYYENLAKMVHFWWHFSFSHRHGNPQGQESQMRAHPSLHSLQLNSGSLSLLKPKDFMEKM
jgi:hypothetical protein